MKMGEERKTKIKNQNHVDKRNRDERHRNGKESTERSLVTDAKSNLDRVTIKLRL